MYAGVCVFVRRVPDVNVSALSMCSRLSDVFGLYVYIYIYIYICIVCVCVFMWCVCMSVVCVCPRHKRVVSPHVCDDHTVC